MTDIDNKAADAACEIEDVFCRDFPGGRAQRLAAIQTVIANAMRRLWDERVKRMERQG